MDKSPTPTASPVPATISKVRDVELFSATYESGTKSFLSFHTIQFAQLSTMMTSESE